MKKTKKIILLVLSASAMSAILCWLSYPLNLVIPADMYLVYYLIDFSVFALFAAVVTARLPITPGRKALVFPAGLGAMYLLDHVVRGVFFWVFVTIILGGFMHPSYDDLPPKYDEKTMKREPPGLPPDPGRAGQFTIEGIDSDNDGVRDDVQRYIALVYPESKMLRLALRQAAKDIQNSMNILNEEKAVNHVRTISSKAGSCRRYMVERYNVKFPQKKLQSHVVWAKLRDQVINTYARERAYFRFNKFLGGHIFNLESDDAKACAFYSKFIKE